MNSVIIAASAGCGKTTLAQKYPDIVAYIESSVYKYLLGTMTKAEIEAAKHTKREDNPDFPHNYIDAIINAGKTHKIVCVWLNRIILPEYDRHGIPYILCYPDHEAVMEYRQRFIDRGNNDLFINHVMDTYDYYIDQWETMPGEKIVLHKGETLESRLEVIYETDSDRHIRIRKEYQSP